MESNEITPKDIIDYFNSMYAFYFKGWSNEHLHYGFWFSETKTHYESLFNHIKIIADELNINRDDIVLDAGCGSGGTCKYFNHLYSAVTIGITNSENLIREAATNIKNRAVYFVVADYASSIFKNSVFSKIVAIESACYAIDKELLVRQLSRIIEKGGKIAISDAFLINENQSPDETKILNDFLNGWSIPGLLTVNEFTGILKKYGFNSIQYTDQTELIYRSSELIYTSARELLPSFYSKAIHDSTNMLNQNQYTIRHLIAQIRQKECIDMGIWSHGRITAKKS